jgi:hypothetical protein
MTMNGKQKVGRAAFAYRPLISPEPPMIRAAGA